MEDTKDDFLRILEQARVNFSSILNIISNDIVPGLESEFQAAIAENLLDYLDTETKKLIELAFDEKEEFSKD